MPARKSDLKVKEKPAPRKKKTKEVPQETAPNPEFRTVDGPQPIGQNDGPLQNEESIPPILPPSALAAVNTPSTPAPTTGQTALSSDSASSLAERKPQKRKLNRQVNNERFDLNTVIVSGAIHAVWGSGADVFARLGLSRRGQLLEEDDQFLIYVTLRFADGMAAGRPISIQKGEIVSVRGYLTHHDYEETLRKFLNDAHALSFFDLVAPEDLPLWRDLSFKRQNGIINVLEMPLLDPNSAPAGSSSFNNRACVEGIIARVWEYPRNNEIDLFARLAVYDDHTPLDPKRAGNFGRARRMAHYITVRFPCGKTSSGSRVHLKPRMRLRIVGELQDRARSVTLREELLRTAKPAVIEMMQRVQNAERLNEITNQQESLHIVPDAVVVYSTVGGSR